MEKYRWSYMNNDCWKDWPWPRYRQQWADDSLDEILILLAFYQLCKLVCHSNNTIPLVFQDSVSRNKNWIEKKLKYL